MRGREGCLEIEDGVGACEEMWEAEGKFHGGVWSSKVNSGKPWKTSSNFPVVTTESKRDIFEILV